MQINAANKLHTMKNKGVDCALVMNELRHELRDKSELKCLMKSI